jgi:hypothetical protein
LFNIFLKLITLISQRMEFLNNKSKSIIDKYAQAFEFSCLPLSSSQSSYSNASLSHRSSDESFETDPFNQGSFSNVTLRTKKISKVDSSLSSQVTQISEKSVDSLVLSPFDQGSFSNVTLRTKKISKVDSSLSSQVTQISEKSVDSLVLSPFDQGSFSNVTQRQHKNSKNLLVEPSLLSQNNNFSAPALLFKCKFCLVNEFVFDGKSLENHQKNCPLNPINLATVSSKSTIGTNKIEATDNIAQSPLPCSLKFKCKFCFIKEYKVNGKPLENHQKICLKNPLNVISLPKQNEVVQTDQIINETFSFSNNYTSNFVSPKSKPLSSINDNVTYICKHCSVKKYKSNGKMLLNHQNKCLYNPLNSNKITYPQFKLMLPKEGKCPNCLSFNSNLRNHSINCFCQVNDFSPFISTLLIIDDRRVKRKIALEKKAVMKVNLNNFNELPFFKCFLDHDLSKNAYKFNTNKYRNKNVSNANHIDQLIQFNKDNNNEFLFLQLNIQGAYSKMNEVDEILNLGIVSAFAIFESRFDASVPESYYQHEHYDCYRLDMCDGKGHGILLFILNAYKPSKPIIYTDFETLYFQLRIGNQVANFITAYKSPSSNNIEFLNKLEDFLFLNTDNSEPLFIFGDLNMDLKSEKGDDLKDFLINNDYKNFIDDYTRIATYECSTSGELRTTKTCLDIVISNGDKVTKTSSFSCYFSDHNFVIASLAYNSLKHLPFTSEGRNLSEANMIKIAEEIAKLDLDAINAETSVDLKWVKLKEALLAIIDSIAPVKTIKIKRREKFPWEDKELYESNKEREAAYYEFANDRNNLSKKETLANLKAYYQSLKRKKMTEFFLSKKTNDFKNSK